MKDSIREDRRFSSSFETNIDQKILKGIVSDAIERLPAEDRIIVILYYYEDMPLKDIGEVVGIKENHVKIKLHRIRSKLMQYLQNKKEIISTIIEKK